MATTTPPESLLAYNAPLFVEEDGSPVETKKPEAKDKKTSQMADILNSILPPR